MRLKTWAQPREIKKKNTIRVSNYGRSYFRWDLGSVVNLEDGLALARSWNCFISQPFISLFWDVTQRFPVAWYTKKRLRRTIQNLRWLNGETSWKHARAQIVAATLLSRLASGKVKFLVSWVRTWGDVHSYSTGTDSILPSTLQSCT